MSFRIIFKDPCEELWLSKLSSKFKDKYLVGDIGEFIYFGQKQGNCKPFIIFPTGIKNHIHLIDMPRMEFDIYGHTSIAIKPWMNNGTCPNIFNDYLIENLSYFVKKFLPILLLVWQDMLDESEVLLFFEGKLTASELIKEIYNVDPKWLEEFKELSTFYDIYKFMISNNLFEKVCNNE